jgi:hypothetical protein
LADFVVTGEDSVCTDSGVIDNTRKLPSMLKSLSSIKARQVEISKLNEVDW